MYLRVTCDEARLGRSLASVFDSLGAGNPSIRVRLEDGQIQVAVHTLKDGEDEIVAKRLGEVLSA